MNSIQNASLSPPTLPTLSTSTTQTSDGATFKDFLVRSIGEVNDAQLQADQAVESLMTGGDVDPAAVMTAVQKADLAFRMMMQMRNKVLSVYQEVKDIRI